MWLNVAAEIARLGTCGRRQVGCVLTDDRGRVLSTGYNGPPRGQTHCTDVPCPGRELHPGTGLSLCEAVHAEANALLHLQRHFDYVHTCYTTVSPCLDCVKLLLQTSCQHIVFRERYAHDRLAHLRWVSGRGGLIRTWEQAPCPPAR